MGNSILARAEHKWYLLRKRKKLKNKQPTVLSSNCNGAFILHDLDCRFNSPTVNLYIQTADFLKFLAAPAQYLGKAPEEVVSNAPFPVGRIDDITIYFMHYKSFSEAREKWVERSARVDYDDLFIIMSDRNGCTREHIAAFDALPYPHRVIFTHRPYPEFKSAFYIKGFEDQEEVGVLSDWKPGFWKRRWLDAFDSVAFLNGDIYHFSGE